LIKEIFDQSNERAVRRNPLNDRAWLRASTRGCDAYTNRP